MGFQELIRRFLKILLLKQKKQRRLSFKRRRLSRKMLDRLADDKRIPDEWYDELHELDVQMLNVHER